MIEGRWAEMTEQNSTANSCRTAVVYRSQHHGNTFRIAQVLAQQLSAELLSADEAAERDLSQYDLVGLGSGIYFGRHSRVLRKLVAGWAAVPKRVFLFSTAGLPFLKVLQHASLRGRLRRRGCEVVGEFCCRGWDTVGPLWLIGGINRKRPNDRDRARAGRFAAELRSRLAGTANGAASMASGVSAAGSSSQTVS